VQRANDVGSFSLSQEGLSAAMSESDADLSPPLRTVVLAMSVREEILGRFRAEFPEIRFIVPGEGAATEGASVTARAMPTEEEVKDADALIGWELPQHLLEAATRLRWMHAAGAGVERYELAQIAARGVMLTNSSGVSAPNMAEHVLGMMIALTRWFPRLLRAQTRREWRDQATHREVGELQGQTVLIVGIGEIGCAVARRAAAFGMRVTGLRRRAGVPPPDGFDQVFGSEDLPAALADADHVVLTLPNTPRSRGLFDAAAFAAMKPGAAIYNVGRGQVIDTTALIAALESGYLGGAGLDVTDPEPLPADSPLWDMENVLITAHTSGATPRYWERQADLIAENIRRIQRGDAPRNLVDLEAGY
jgi:phosphoglycerate dehydrogenase-like enzyme